MALVALGVWAFFWAVGSGQFDDLDSPGWSVLGDEQERSQPGQASAPAIEPQESTSDPTQATKP